MELEFADLLACLAQLSRERRVLLLEVRELASGKLPHREEPTMNVPPQKIQRASAQEQELTPREEPVQVREQERAQAQAR